MNSIGPNDEEITYENLLDRVKREAGEKIAEFKKRGWAPREKIDEWKVQAARGERSRVFMGSEFWKKDLQPLIRGESEIKPCRPDAVAGSLDQAATEYLYKSGGSWMARMIESKMCEWIVVGDKAAASLRDEAAKNK